MQSQLCALEHFEARILYCASGYISLTPSPYRLASASHPCCRHAGVGYNYQLLQDGKVASSLATTAWLAGALGTPDEFAPLLQGCSAEES